MPSPTRTGPSAPAVSVAASRHSPPARPSPAARLRITRRTSTMPRPRGILTRSRSSMRSDDGSPGRPSPRHDLRRRACRHRWRRVPRRSRLLHLSTEEGSRACVEPHPRPENCSRPASSRSCRRRRRPAPGAPSPSLVRPERPATRPRAGPPGGGGPPPDRGRSRVGETSTTTLERVETQEGVQHIEINRRLLALGLTTVLVVAACGGTTTSSSPARPSTTASTEAVGSTVGVGRRVESAAPSALAPDPAEAVIPGVEAGANIKLWTFFLSPTFDQYIQDTVDRFERDCPA